MHPRAEELLVTLELSPHPEGGFYRQVYKSPRIVDPRDGRDARSALTAIYFLLPAGHYSRWHRVRSDEIWTHIEGTPVTLHLLDEDQSSNVQASSVRASSVTVERRPVVPAGVWQAAEPSGDYALVACFVAPGFEFADFTLMSDGSRLPE